MVDLVLKDQLKSRYGIWGTFNSNIFQFLNLLVNEKLSELFIIQLIFGFQVSTIWSLIIFKVLIL